MQIVRWDPFRDRIAFGTKLGRTADASCASGGADSYGTWAPPVDIFEKDDQLVFRAEVPGVAKDQLNVRIENGVLSLDGERKQESEINEENAYRLERTFGRFTRSFTLPTTVDANKVTATFKDGILEVNVPKAESAKPKQVQIQVA
jgi:HSP20 family protein